MLEIRKASLTDIPALLGLINAYASQGIMLPRTEFEMAENIRDFLVAFNDGRLVGCGALHLYTPTAGEIRSLAVEPGLKQRGSGAHCFKVSKPRHAPKISIPSLRLRMFPAFSASSASKRWTGASCRSKRG